MCKKLGFIRHINQTKGHYGNQLPEAACLDTSTKKNYYHGMIQENDSENTLPPLHPRRPNPPSIPARYVWQGGAPPQKTGLKATSKRPGHLKATSKRPRNDPTDLKTTSKRPHRPQNDLKTTSKRPQNDLKTTSKRPSDLKTTSKRPQNDLGDLKTTSKRLGVVFWSI